MQWYTFHKFIMLGKKSRFRHAIRNDQRDEHTSCKFVIIKTIDPVVVRDGTECWNTDQEF